MTESDDGAWFAPKTMGYGAGLPIAWQGWVLLAVMMVAAVGLGVWLGPAHPGLAIGAVIGINLLFLPLIKARTRGGWRWRSGRK
jgi:hypothetical protein